MQFVKKIGSRTQSAALSVVPILVVSFAVIGSMSFLAKNAFEHNEQQALLTDQRRIDQALKNEAYDFADHVQREVSLIVQSSPDRKVEMSKIIQHITDEHRVDFVAVYSKEGKLVSIHAARPELTERRLKVADELLAERRELKTPFAIRRLGMSATLVDSRALIAMAAINVDNLFEVVLTKRMEERTLAKIGSTLMLGDLRFRDAPLNDANEPEHPVTTLVWNQVHDGSFTLQSLASIGFMGIAVIGIYGLLVFLHIRRVTRALELSEAQAQHQAGHDPLSGLPNRSLFSRALDHELARITRDGGGLAVMYLDLDKFKDVNDVHGHEAGDRLIMQVASRLSDLVRGADTVSRFGGDEFAVIQTSVRSIAEAEILAHRILDELHRPFVIGEVEVRIGCSIGISVAPDNGTDAVHLMRYADIALYRAKNEGRNRYSFFEHQMNETLRVKKVIEDNLRSAIENNDLVLHYQPVVTADGSRIVTLEALVRWNHPETGLIPPNHFIAIAEERGLIGQLGEWVLRKACMDGKQWPGMTIAVNVSPVQFRQRDFVATVARILAETGFDASRLELELTEGVVVDDADMAERAISELRAMGVRFALDDFGVGYSSLIYLRRFAFDRIKIDKSFLDSMEATGEPAILIHSIVHLGRALGLEVTAEGVETEEQQRFLQAVGCHHLQGFLFSRPRTASDMTELLAKASGVNGDIRRIAA